MIVIERTVKVSRKGHLEIIFRDIYTLKGDKKRPGKAVDISREVIDKYWI